jgi:hypothetical protein
MANPNDDILIELLLPLWHRDTKKGQERCYTPMRSLIVFILGLVLGTGIEVLISFLNIIKSHGLLAMMHIGGARGDLLKGLPVSQTLAPLAIGVSAGR